MSSVSIYLQREYGKNGKPRKREQFCCGVDNLLELAEDKAATYRLEEMPCNLPSSVRAAFLITFSHDGLKVASACGDHNVWVCEVRTGKLLKTLKGHPRTPWCLAFHPTSNDILASGCLGGEVRVWDLHGGSEVWVVEQKQAITSLAFHPTDKVLVIATLNQLHFWDWSLPEPFATCQTNSDKEKVRYVKFDTHGTRLITGILNVPPESQRSHLAESLFGSATFPRAASTRSISAQRTSILNRLMILYSHLEGLEEISRYTGSSTNQTSSFNRSGALSPTQDDALQRARLFAEEVSIHNAHLYRQRLYNLDQALGLQSGDASDVLEDHASTSQSSLGPSFRNSHAYNLFNESQSSASSVTSLPTSSAARTQAQSESVAGETSSESQMSSNPSSQSNSAANTRSSVGFSSVNSDFWVTFHRLRFICSSLERRIQQQPPPSLFADMPHLPSTSADQFPSLPVLLNNFIPELGSQRTAAEGHSPFVPVPTQSSNGSQSSPSCPQIPSRNNSRSNRSPSETGPTSPDVSVSLVSLLTRLQHSLQSLSNAALTTAVARDQIQQVRTRIAEILERLDNVSGYRARLTNLRDQIYEAADRMAQRGEDNTQSQRRDLAYCLWLVEMSLQLTRDMQRILATDYRLTQLHLNSSMPNAPISSESSQSTTIATGTASSSRTNMDVTLAQPSTSSCNMSSDENVCDSNSKDKIAKTEAPLEPSQSDVPSASNNDASFSHSRQQDNFELPVFRDTNSNAVRTSISDHISSLLNSRTSTSGLLPNLGGTPQSESSYLNLPFHSRVSLSSGNLSDISRASSLAQLASERLPNPFNVTASQHSESLTDSQFRSYYSPFYWRNRLLRGMTSPSNNVDSVSGPTVVQPVPSSVELLLDLGLEQSQNNIYQLGTSRNSPFVATNRGPSSVNSENPPPPTNDASTSTSRVSFRPSNQASGTTSAASSSNHLRSASIPRTSSVDRPQSALGRGISSRIISSAVRPTRTAIARRRWLNYRMSMSPTSLRRRRLYRWSCQQPTTGASGGTQLVVNPHRHSRQSYADSSDGSVQQQHLPRSINRSSATGSSENSNLGGRISRRIRCTSSPSTSTGQSGVIESEIILNRLRTVHRERMDQHFTIPFVQIDHSTSPSDGELPPLPPEQRPRSPPLSAILSRSPPINSFNSVASSLNNTGPSALNYLGVGGPRLGAVPPYWSHFYDAGLRSRGMGGVADSNNLTYRIQCWDFSNYIIPNISQSESSIVVPKCKINNDGSVDISKDGKFLATIVPNIANMRQSTMVAVYSLSMQNIGQCLYTWNFENTNVVSVSFSPLARYLVIGIGTHRLPLGASEREPVAQIFRLDPFTKNSSLTFVSSVYQESNSGGVRGISGIGGGPLGLNYVRWLPESGQGLIYGTNRGSLLICRPVSSNSDSHYVSPLHLVSTATQTTDQDSNSQPEMQTTGTQTLSSQTVNDSEDDDDDDDDD